MLYRAFSVDDGSKMNHITLARKPDHLVAPATANIMGKYAMALPMTSPAPFACNFFPVFLAPSMNPVMWK